MRLKHCNLFIIFLLLSSCLFFAGCSDEDGKNEKDIELANSKKDAEQEGHADDVTTGSGFTFTAKLPWRANVSESSVVQNSSRSNSGVTWLRLLVNGTETYNGEAGTVNMSIEMDINYTGSSRSAQIVIVSGNSEITITVTQRGTKEDGKVPVIPKLITRITGNPNGYRELPSSEFNYDAKTFKLKEVHIKDKYYSDNYFYDYSILNEIRITDDEGNYYSGKMGSNGYVNSIDNTSSYYYDLRRFTYTENEYLNSYMVAYKDDGDERKTYKYVWDKENVIHIWDDWEVGDDEEVDNPTFLYNTELNDKTTIDLNTFIFETLGVYEGFHDSDYGMHLFALIDKAGKRSKNYLTGGFKLSSMVDGVEEILYTAATLPKVGEVVTTTSREQLNGNAFYEFDGEGYPISFNQRITVTRTEYIYDGERKSRQPENEYQKESWEQRYGPGPWFEIETTPKNLAPVNYTYKLSIEYNK